MNILVRNANGTSHFTVPSHYANWLEYWESHKTQLNENELYRCPACNKYFRKSELVGAHVSIVNSYRLFIVPICRNCNNRTNNFTVDEDLLVEIPSRL